MSERLSSQPKVTELIELANSGGCTSVSMWGLGWEWRGMNGTQDSI